MEFEDNAPESAQSTFSKAINKRKPYTLEEKKKIIDMLTKNKNNRSMVERLTGVDRRMIGYWWRKRFEIEAALTNKGDSFRLGGGGRKTQFKLIEDQVC